MNSEKFKDSFGSWFESFLPFIESEEMDEIYKKLKEDSQRNRRICPSSENTFNAFKYCPKEKLKCVFLGLSPYPTIYNGIYTSDGLSFSCGNTNKEQPSLSLLWNAVEEDLNEGNSLGELRELSLKRWAEEGVLLLNCALSCEELKPTSHVLLWRPFMKYFFEEVLSGINGLPVIFVGKESAYYERYTQPFIHYVKKLEHMAYSFRVGREWKHENCFSWINNILKNNNGKEFEIPFIDLPF